MGGAIGVRLNRRHQDMIRAKIQCERLVALLHAFIFKERFQHEKGRVPVLDSNRLKAISMLLNKSLPDLHSTHVSGEVMLGKVSAEMLANLPEKELDQFIDLMERLGVSRESLARAEQDASA